MFGTSTRSEPHELTVQSLVHTKWNNFEHDVQEKIGHLERAYLVWRRRLLLAIGSFVGWTVMVFVLSLPNTWWVTVPSLVAGVWGVYALYRYNNANQQFAVALDPLVYAKVFSILGLRGHHTEAGTEEVIRPLLNQSELITEPRNTLLFDDVVETQFADRPLTIAELDAKHVTGSGKNRTVKHIFHGVFVIYTLPQRVEGKTFVSTEGDKRGFGHQNFWSQLFSATAPRTTLLEWNEFENNLHVATTNETEARYILTPDSMSALYDWWVDRPGHIRLSFIADRLYILFPDRQTQLTTVANSLSRDDLQTYLASVVRPLWHTMELLQRVNERFRS